MVEILESNGDVHVDMKYWSSRISDKQANQLATAFSKILICILQNPQQAVRNVKETLIGEGRLLV